MDTNISGNYKNKSQKARVITETWLLDNFKCPFCNSDNIMIKCSNFEKISIKGSEFCEYQGKDSSLKSKDKKRLWGKMGMVKSQKTPTGNAYLDALKKVLL